MNASTRVLVGIDLDASGKLTPGSDRALRTAAWFAERTGAQLALLYSRYHNPEDAPREPLGPDDVEARVKSTLEGLPDRPAALSEETTLWISDAPPWLAILERARSDAADLVVVAKRNHTRKDDRRLGSTSMRLVHHCPVPVWVVRPDHPSKHETVLAATDLSVVGDAAVHHAGAIARADGCELYVVHAWQVPLELQMSAARMGAERAAEEKRALSETAKAHIRALPAFAEMGDAAHVLLANDAPSRAILAATERLDPDLVVLGSISRSGLAGMVIGNTAERLLYALDTSLLTIKPEDFACDIELDIPPPRKTSL